LLPPAERAATFSMQPIAQTANVKEQVAILQKKELSMQILVNFLLVSAKRVSQLSASYVYTTRDSDQDCARLVF
jgi:hypothetical protein